MLKLLNAEQTRQADKHTIENEPISSIELMERASLAFVKFFIEKYANKNLKIAIYCGKGNNGGDGLAIARLLINERYTRLNIIIADFEVNETNDFRRNLELLQELDTSIFYLKLASDLEFEESDIIIDALFGIGLNRSLEGEWVKIIKKINHFPGIKVSVDIPSGMLSEGEFDTESIFKSDLVITFQRPKLNFLLPASNPYIKEWKVVNIGLDENFIESTGSPFYWFWKKDVQTYLRPRKAFDHKGTLGHALIFAGTEETMGAALLSAAACHKTGCGLTSVSIPHNGLTALNSRLPEVMYVNRDKIKSLDWSIYNAIGLGPGLGVNDASLDLIKTVLGNFKKPLVIDADGLNLLSENKELMALIPENSILTPHMKEFDRLFGEHANWWERINSAFENAKRFKIYIVLKNRYTMIFSPQGMCYFNSSGSPAMASGGMGDVLTGMITSLIAQGYQLDKAVLLAVFSHGYIGEQLGQVMYTVCATNIIKQIPRVFKEFML